MHIQALFNREAVAASSRRRQPVDPRPLAFPASKEATASKSEESAAAFYSMSRIAVHRRSLEHSSSLIDVNQVEEIASLS